MSDIKVDVQELKHFQDIILINNIGILANAKCKIKE